MNRVGLAIPASSINDRFVVTLVHALADSLIRNGFSLVTKVVPDRRAEQQLYHHWEGVGGITGVALLEVEQNDTRVELLRSHGFPIAAVAGTTVAVDFPTVVVDFDSSIDVLRAFLATRPHRRTVYIHSVEEGAALSARIAATRDAELDGLFEVVHTGPSPEAAAAAASAAISDGPVTLVFDSDMHAASALATFRSRDIQVPLDVAIVSWTNSALCQSASRSITTIDRRGSEIGALLGTRMLGAIAGDRETHDRAPQPLFVLGETA
jgi:LacI family repressor for deo operon, udp, cdd, tsx, nupC, and nupG